MIKYVTPDQVAKRNGKSRIWVNKRLQAGQDIPFVLSYAKAGDYLRAPYLIIPDTNFFPLKKRRVKK